MNVYETIKYINSSGIFDTVLNGMTLYYQGVALALGMFLYTVNMCINMWNTAAELRGQIFNFKELLKSGTPIVLIIFYPLIFGPAAFVIDKLNYVTALKGDQATALNTKIQELASQSYEYNYHMDSTLAVGEASKLSDEASTELANSSGGVAAGIASAVFSPFTSGVMAVINMIVGVLLTCIRIVISSIGIFLFKTLYVLGPFAFAFSVLPTFRSSADTWFASWLGMGMIHNTFNILETVVYTLVAKDAALYTNLSSSNVYADISLSLTMIGAYISVFWLTSKYISGSGDNGKVMSNLMQMVQTASGVSMAASAVSSAGNGSTASNVAEAGRSGMDTSSGKKPGIEA